MSDKIQKLKQVLELLQNDTVTPADLKAFLEFVLKFIKESKDGFQTISEENQLKINQALTAIAKHAEAYSLEVDSKLTKAQAAIDAKLNEAQAVLEEYKNLPKPEDGQPGADADEESIIEKVMKRIVLPTTLTTAIITGQEIVDKINEMPIDHEEYLIDVSHIKGLHELVRESYKGYYGGGNRFLSSLVDVDLTGLTKNSSGQYILGGGSGSPIFIDQTPLGDTYGFLSGVVDGSNTTFVVSEGAYTSGTLEVTLDGLSETQGAPYDWVETNPTTGTFDFTIAPPIGSRIKAIYGKSAGTGTVTTVFETNGTLNGSQTLVNNIAGSNMTIIDDGLGNVTYSATGGSQDLQSVTDVGNTTTNDIDMSGAGTLYSNSLVGEDIGLSGTSTGTKLFLGTNFDIHFQNFGDDLQFGGGGGMSSMSFAPSGGGFYNYGFPLASGYLALSVNGNTADSAGNITISTGSGTVTSVAALTLGTTGTDLSSSVANSTTTPVITLNVPTASATNRGALSSTDWSTFNGKESALTFSTGLTRATNTITANLSTGVSGGQSVIGGTASGNALTLSSTSNATKGLINFGTSNYDESVNQLNITNSAQDTAVTLTGNINSSFQDNLQNTNSGASASGDRVVTANNGTATTHYIDFGINSSGGGSAPFTVANEAYVYSIDDTLNLGALGSSSQLRFFTTGGTSPVQRMVIDNAGLVGINQTTPTSRLHITRDAIATTQSDAYGIFLQNSTAATAGVTIQYSPAITFRGSTWLTTAPASATLDYHAFARPVSGSTVAAHGGFVIQQSLNGGAYSDTFEVGQTIFNSNDYQLKLGGNNVIAFGGGVTQYYGGSNGFAFYNSAGSVQLASMSNVGVWALTPSSNTATSGTVSSWIQTAGFAPTSGTGVFNTHTIAGTINQTGGANGITRGIYVKQTITAAADYRAIETNNNTGIQINAAGSAPSVFGGVIRHKGYTVAGLPTGVIGDVAYITDGTVVPAKGVAPVGGGTSVGVVFYDGTAWVGI